jgi:RNA polymerase sigma-70 factor (ECF subfamily)
MDEVQWLTGRFQEHRPRLRAVAYQMLGSLADVDDALQDAWLRADAARTPAADINDPGAWLTTVVARICLNMLRTRRSRPEEPWDGHLPDPVVLGLEDTAAPEDAALHAESVGLALLIVLETLSPDERVAFVLHDLFDMPFADIAAVLERSSAAARQPASRVRRRVAGAGLTTPPDRARQRELVEAFFAAARGGDLDALMAVPHPDVVARADFGGRRLPAPAMIQGAATVAENARLATGTAGDLTPAWVNGAAGALVLRNGRPALLMAFTVSEGRIAALDVYGDRDRVRHLTSAFWSRKHSDGDAREKR